MTKIDSLKLVLFLLSSSCLLLYSCSPKVSQADWLHFLEPCNNQDVFTITGELKPIKQKRRNDCWFTCYAMLKSWKDNTNYSYSEAILFIGDWEKVIKRNLGLWVSEQEIFFEDMNLGFYPPANYTFQAYVDFIKLHGPLMICMGAAGVNHSRILYKIQCGKDPNSTYFFFINPRSGKSEKWKAPKFFDHFESEAREIMFEHQDLSDEEKEKNRKVKEAWRYQIIYIKWINNWVRLYAANLLV